MVVEWSAVTFEALQDLWQGFLVLLPKLIGALIVFIIGWFISVGIGRLVSEILKRIKFNQLFEKGGWKNALQKADMKVDPAKFIGAIFKWALVIVFLLAAVEILGLVEFADFLTGVLGYIPNVIIAVLIFVVAIIIADILEKLVRASVEGIRTGYAQMAGAIVKWAIWVFAILAILIQLKVAPSLIQTIFTGAIAMLVISTGLAFGLGGRDAAKEILADLRSKLRG